MKPLLTDGDNLQIVSLRPVDEPRSELVSRRGVRLVHQGDVSVPAGPSLSELCLALGGRLSIPVTGVDIVRYNVVAEGPHHGGDATTGLKVRWAHVPGLLAEDVDVGLLQLGHLRRQLRRGHRAHVAVRPGVRCHLVAAFVGGLDRCRLVVDASCLERSEKHTCT